jgi:hypothetical protein
MLTLRRLETDVISLPRTQSSRILASHFVVLSSNFSQGIIDVVSARIRSSEYCPRCKVWTLKSFCFEKSLDLTYDPAHGCVNLISYMVFSFRQRIRGEQSIADCVTVVIKAWITTVCF